MSGSRLSAYLCSVALAALSTGAFGQMATAPVDQSAASPSSLEEVVVTAERRETKLQKTPVAVTSFNSAQLERLGIQDTRDLLGFVPDLYMGRVSTAPSTQTYGMRGLAQTDTVADPTVGVYIDDIYLPRSLGAMFQLPDLQRAEVLRGPQGTLYGRNSTAGAIKYITLDPSNEIQGSASIGIGDYGEFQAKGLLSGPIVENKLFADIAFVHDQRDGYTYDAYTKSSVNNLDTDSVRAKVRFTPTDDFEAKLTLDGVYDGSNTTVYVPFTVPNGQPHNPYVTYENNGYNGKFGPNDDLHEGGLALNLTYNLNDQLTLKSISAARAFYGPYDNEDDGLPTIGLASFSIYHEHEYTQELQLLGDFDPVKFSTGFYYFHEGYELHILNLNKISNGIADAYLLTNSYAGYAQADYAITDQLTLTAGARYTIETRNIDEDSFAANAADVATHLNYDAAASHGYHAFNPKVSLQYQLTPDLMAYASYSQGFQAGGYSLRAAVAAVAQAPYGPEKVTTYEAGLKATWLDHTLSTNFALFYNDIDGFQATAFVPSLLTSTIINAGTAYTEGVEAEIMSAPLAGLQLSGSFSALRANYTSFPGISGPGTSGVGVPLPFAPKFVASASADYKLPLSIPGETHFAIDVQAQSKTWVDVAFTPAAYSPSQFNVNLHLNYQTEDEHWKGSFTLSNVLDRAYAQYVWYIPSFNTTSSSYNPPRTFKFELTYKY